MSGKVLILNDINFVRENFSKIKEIADRERPDVVPLSDSALLFLEDKGLDCVNYRRFEYQGIYADLYTTAREWGLNWYKPDGKDLSAVDSFSLGNIIEWSMIYFFSHLLRLYLSITQIVKNLRPKEILVLTSKNTPLMQEPIRSTSIPALDYADVGLLPHILKSCLQFLHSPAKMRIIDIPYPYPKDEKPKAAYLIRSILTHFSQTLSLLYKIYNSNLKRRKGILFFEGFHHFYGFMKSPLLKGYDKIHLQKTIGPSLLLKLYNKGIRIMLLNPDRKNLNNSNGPEFNLEGIKEKVSDFFIYRGEDILSCIWPRLEVIFNKYFPQIYKDCNLVAEAIEKNRPSCVVVESDQTYYDKMLISIAKKKGIYTVVIQHGLSLSRDAYGNDKLVVHHFYPMTADRFFCFGQVFKDWFTSMDADGDKITVIGGARFDGYYVNRKRHLGQDKRGKTVLIVLNDIWFHEGVITHHIRLNVFYNHMQTFIELARENPDVSFIIRPHFNEHQWGRLFREDLNSLDNLIICLKEPVEELLSYVNLVIGYTSTVLLEALTCGIPVISLDTGEYYNYQPFWKYGLSRRVSSMEELNREVQRLLYDDHEKRLLKESIEKGLHLFNYNNDGLASERGARELDRIMSTV